MSDAGGPRLSHVDPSAPDEGVRRQMAPTLQTLAITLSLQMVRGRGAHDRHEGQQGPQRRAVSVCHGTNRGTERSGTDMAIGGKRREKAFKTLEARQEELGQE